MSSPTWTAERVEHLLRKPHILLEDPLWQPWFAEHAGLHGVYATLRTVPLKAHLASLLALLLDDPHASWQSYAEQLLVVPSTYYRQFKTLQQQLVAVLPQLLPWPAPAAAMRGVPVRTSTLIGREAALAAVQAALDASVGQIVTLIGPGGVGKTRLALEVACERAARYPDGVVWVSLVASRTADEVAQALGQALGLEGGSNLELRLIYALQQQRILLVVDNAEHVLSAAGLLGQLSQAPHSQMLVTSRTPLQVPNEQLLRLDPLATQSATGEAAAIELFLDRAAQALGEPAAARLNRDEVLAICTQASGLPLAIELLAARTAVLSVETIREQFAALPLRSVQQDDLSVDSRHASLDAALNWSFRLLTRRTRWWLLAASVCRAGWDLAALDALAGSDVEPGEAQEAMLRLLQTSLIQREVTGLGRERFGMLDLVRRYAEEQLPAELGEAAAIVRTRHATHYLGLARQWAAVFEEPDHAAEGRWLRQERANIQAALEWCLDGGGSRRLGLEALNELGIFLKYTQPLADVYRYFTHVQTTLDWAADTELIYDLTREQLYLLQQLGRMHDAYELVETCLARGIFSQDQRHVLLCNALGGIIAVKGMDAAFKQLFESLDFFLVHQQYSKLSWVYDKLGRFYQDSGEYTKSLEYFHLSLKYTQNISMNNINTASVYIDIGKFDLARDLLDKTLPLINEMNTYYQSAILKNFAEIDFYGQNYQSAQKYYMKVFDYNRSGKFVLDPIDNTLSIAEIEFLMQRYSHGIDYVEEVLPTLRSTGNTYLIVRVLQALCAATQTLAWWSETARLLAAAEQLQAIHGLPMAVMRKQYLEQISDAAQQALTPTQWAAACAEGMSLSAESAMEDVFEWITALIRRIQALPG